MRIEKNTIGEAWLAATEKVLKSGETIMDGKTKLLELLDLSIEITDPSNDDAIIKKFANPDMIKWMEKKFLGIEPVKDWGYSYGERIFSYKGIDQFAMVAEKLKKNPDSKSATISLMYPPEDTVHVPCACIIDFKLRKGKLNLFSTFRSQDIFKKNYADSAVLAKLLQRMAKETGSKVGSLNIHIISAHIYEPDFEAARNLLKLARK